MLRLPVLTVLFSVCLYNMPLLEAASRIEADPNKEYKLTRDRGPWMISVATFHTTDPEGVTREGKSPEEAAHELVIELRQLGMPAYVYVHEPDQARVTVTDRIGRDEVRKNLRRVRTVLVVAGNYQDLEDKLAQDSLKWVKRLNPKCLQEGVAFSPTKSRPTPLAGAFLAINPLLSPDEVMRDSRDPLLIRLNSGENHSLADNRGEYTLVIARFYGKQNVLLGSKAARSDQDVSIGNTLDQAGFAAQELTAVLRGKYDPSNTYNNIDAYVWHDRSESIVTVGSFTSDSDPSIERYKKLFGPRLETFPDGRTNYQPAHFALEGFGKRKNETRLWIFEPTPQLMRVPRLK